MTAENLDLDAKYNVLRLSVISSTAISNRTTALIKHLESEKSDGKTAIVGLHAKASVASKLISIIEIAKRELKDKNIKIYQYNALGSEIVNLDRKAKSGDGGKEGVSEDEEAFETLGQKPTIRNVPTMTVFVSVVPVKELREAYGEQSG